MRKIEIGTLSISDKAKKYVNQVLDSNRLSYGDFSRKFEKLFAEKHDCKYAVITNSGTSALHVAIAALKKKYGWKDHEEILVPATTFVATVNTVIHNNLIPVLIDVDEHFHIDMNKLHDNICSYTRAILPVHLLGSPCQMDEIEAVAKKYDLRIIEDSCECMLATFNGKKVGSFGDVGCFSTYIAHLLTTGVGGICTTNDPDLAVMMRSLNNHGRDSIYISIDDDDNKSDSEMKEIIAKRFSFIHLGHSFRLTEMEWALGLAQLEDELEDIISVRQKNAAYLTEKFIKYGIDKFIELPKIRKNSTHSFMIYGIVTKEEKKYDLVEFLENNGIETRDLLPLLNQPIYEHKDIADKWLVAYNKNELKNSLHLIDHGFYIGCHQGLDKDDLDYIVHKFAEYFF